ncbi:hypothetical protein [Kribbella antibiotica]|nr:hypothetical protein [Kribbella antibiotica]
MNVSSETDGRRWTMWRVLRSAGLVVAVVVVAVGVYLLLLLTNF